MDRTSSRIGWFILLVGLLIGCGSSDAADGPAPNLPPAVEQALWWLPEDTETLIVARPFVHVTEPQVGPARIPTWRDVGSYGAFNGLFGVNKDEAADRADTTPLNDHLMVRIESLVMGGRDFQGVSSFGAIRSENATIIRFADDPATGEDWAATYRRQARSVRTIAGREVFVFPARFVTESWVRPTEWEGSYIVVLDARTLLLATSDRFLTTVLGRIDKKPATRAMPDALPEWREVDPQSSCWLVRHYPAPAADLGAVGVTVTWRADGFRVAYVAQPGRKVDREIIEGTWLPSTEDRKRPHTRFDTPADGSLILNYDAPIDLEDTDLWFVWNMHWVMGQAPVRRARN